MRAKGQKVVYNIVLLSDPRKDLSDQCSLCFRCYFSSPKVNLPI